MYFLEVHCVSATVQNQKEPSKHTNKSKRHEYLTIQQGTKEEDWYGQWLIEEKDAGEEVGGGGEVASEQKRNVKTGV